MENGNLYMGSVWIMENEERLFNLLTQIQGQMNQMQDQIGLMQVDMKSFDKNQSSMQNQIGLLQSDMKSFDVNQISMQDQIGLMQSDVKGLSENQNSMQDKINTNHQEVLGRFDRVDDKLNELEGTNAANHVIIKTNIIKLSDDLEFLTHKEFENEKSVYNIKKKLEVIK